MIYQTGLAPGAAIVAAQNTWTAENDFQSRVTIASAGAPFYSPNALVDIYDDSTDVVDARPVLFHLRRDADPASPPAIGVDYHAADIIVNSASTNVNGNTSFFPLETNAQYTGAGTINRLVAAYGFVNAGAAAVATNVTGDMTCFQALARNLGTGTIAISRGSYLRTPVNSGGGTITEHRSLHIEDCSGVTGITTAYAIKSDGGQSYHSGRVVIGKFAGPTTTNTSLLVQAQGTGSTESAARFQSVAGGTTSATLVAFTDSSNNALISIPWGAAGLNIDPSGATTNLSPGAGVAIRVPPSKPALYVRQAASPTSPVLQIQNSTPADIFRIESNGDHTHADAINFVFGTTTGTKIGTATTQKIAFYNATPIVQPTGTPAAATDLATVISLANSLRTNLLALGLVA